MSQASSSFYFHPQVSPLPKVAAARQSVSSNGRQAGATLIWNVAMIMVRYFRKNGQDIHPGTRVGIDLIVWLGFGAVAVMMAATWSTWDTNMAERYYGGANFVLVQMAVVLATIEALVLPASVGIEQVRLTVSDSSTLPCLSSHATKPTCTTDIKSLSAR